MDTVERWTGPLLLVGGAMYVVASLIHPYGNTSRNVLEPLWVPAHVVEYVAITAILLGLVGWYSRFSSSLGTLGTIGFLLSLLGAAAGSGYVLVNCVLLRPYMAASSVSLDQDLLKDGAYLAATLLIFLTFIAGYLVLSVAFVRAGVLPRWVLWLVAVQIASIGSFFGGTTTYAPVLIGEALFGVSVAGWGFAVLSTRSRVESSDGSEAR